MDFVQIIEMQMSEFDDMLKVGGAWQAATEGKRNNPRRVFCQDRDNPGRYFHIVFFGSYQEAMENSAMPETDALWEEMQAMADGPLIYYNLDVIDDHE